MFHNFRSNIYFALVKYTSTDIRHLLSSQYITTKHAATHSVTLVVTTEHKTAGKTNVQSKVTADCVIKFFKACLH